MNEARRQAARPGDFGGGPDGGRKLPNEVKAMARQMGISAKELSEGMKFQAGHGKPIDEA